MAQHGDDRDREPTSRRPGRDLQEPELRQAIRRWAGTERLPERIRIVTNTTDFFSVGYNNILALEGRAYLIGTTEREGRFGLDDEPKFWVRRAIDLENGQTKVIKMGYGEQFQAHVGPIVFECVRSPAKEARLLDLTRGHPRFMQGFTLRDSAGNPVRVIDRIQGPTLADHILTLGRSHEEYFHGHFPEVFREFLEMVRAIAFLHERGEKHGDIRRDHILLDRETGSCRWIDLDFNFSHATNPFGYDLFGLGNVLCYLTGRGDVTVQELRDSGSPLFHALENDDLNIVFKNRVVNLIKIYPYVPPRLNAILLHFSQGANRYYETCRELLEDLGGITMES